MQGQVRPEREIAEKLRCPIGKENSPGSAEEGKQKTLREVLPDEANATRTESGADGHFTLPRGGANQQDICYVETSDDKNETAQSHEGCCNGRKSIVRIRIGAGKPLGKNANGDAFVRVGMLFGDAPSDDIDRSLCLLQIRTGLKSGHEG